MLNDIVYSGVAIGPINERNVLNNEIPTITYTSGTYNPKWPYFVETFTAAASAEDADTYWARVTGATELIIGSPIKPWRYGLERMEVTYIRAR